MTEPLAPASPSATSAADISAETLLRAAFIRSDNPVLLVEWKTRRILACTPQVERVFGYTAEELKGQTTEILHASHEQFTQFAEVGDPKLESETGTFHSRNLMRRKDGSVFPTENLVSVIRDENNHPVGAISVIHDISGIRESDEKLPESAMHMAPLASNLPGGIFQRVRFRDGREEYTFLRGNIVRNLGLDPVDVQHDPEILFRQMVDEDRERYREQLERSFDELTPIDIVVRYRDSGGDVRFIRSISQPRALDDGSVAWDGIAIDITAERIAEQNLQHIALHDALTGLPNLVAFRDRLEASLARMKRDRTRSIVAVINLRRFRIVNETLGLAAGDMIIRAVGERLANVIHENDFLARFHGDEFLVLIDGLEMEEEIRPALNGLLAAFDEAFELPALRPMLLEARMGLTVAPDDGATVDELLRNADTALHHARREGSSHVQFYQKSMTSNLVEYLELERALEKAISEDRTEPFLQPQYEIASGRLIGLEALARWQHEGEWIPPGRFIPVAEDSGLIIGLGKQLLGRLLKEMQAWRDAGRELVPVSVNFSALQFRDRSFSDWLVETLDASGLERELIQVEVTESVFLHDFAVARELIAEIHEAGFRFSLDDFGTGYSSLSYLSRLPFSVLKIDRSFIQAMADDHRSRSLVRSIIQMGKSLEMSVIAEGVETESQLEQLKQLGCEAVQGFLTGRPMSCEEAGKLLSHRSDQPG